MAQGRRKERNLVAIQLTLRAFVNEKKRMKHKKN